MWKHDQGSAAAAGARRATGATAERDRKGRFSARRKRVTVLRLLRGEDLESVSRELSITAARASQWRDKFSSTHDLGRGLKPRRESVARKDVPRLCLDLEDHVRRVCPLDEQDVREADRVSAKLEGLQGSIFVPRLIADAVQESRDAIFDDPAHEGGRLRDVF